VSCVLLRCRTYERRTRNLSCCGLSLPVLPEAHPGSPCTSALLTRPWPTHTAGVTLHSLLRLGLLSNFADLENMTMNDQARSVRISGSRGTAKTKWFLRTVALVRVRRRPDTKERLQRKCKDIAPGKESSIYELCREKGLVKNVVNGAKLSSQRSEVTHRTQVDDTRKRSLS
jgi:hypothetical protein